MGAADAFGLCRALGASSTSIKSLISVPPECLCPVTQEIMQDPVICADGFTYERQAIETWFRRGNRTSPVTNLVLGHRTLITNRAVKGINEFFLQQMPRVQQQQIDDMRKSVDLEAILDALADAQRAAIRKIEQSVQRMLFYAMHLDHKVHVDVVNYRKCTVGQVKKLLSGKIGMSPEDFILVHDGRTLDAPCNLEVYNVQPFGIGGCLMPVKVLRLPRNVINKGFAFFLDRGC